LSDTITIFSMLMHATYSGNKIAQNFSTVDISCLNKKARYSNISRISHSSIFAGLNACEIVSLKYQS